MDEEVGGNENTNIIVFISEENWYSSLTKNMYVMRNENKFCDTEITSKEGEIFSAHSIVLAAGCELLKNTFTVSPLHTQNFKVKTDEISHTTWECILEYIYLGTARLKPEDLEEMKEAAESLGMDDLKTKCSEAIDMQRHEGNFPLRKMKANQVDQATEIEPEIMKFAAGINETLEFLSGIEDANDTVINNADTGLIATGQSASEGSDVTYVMINGEGMQESYVAEELGSPTSSNSRLQAITLYKGENLSESAPPEAGSVSDEEEANSSLSIATFKQEPDTSGITQEEMENITAGKVVLHGAVGMDVDGNKPDTSNKPAGSYVRRKSRYRVSPKDLVFKCGICDKFYATKQSLERHAMLHSGVMPFTCELCGKCFKTDRYLAAHLERHSADRNYQCPICGKSFKTQRDANWHNKSVHSSARKFQCRYCPYNTKTRALLNQHVFSHTNTKEWVCKTCGKAFLRKQHLEQHATRHDGKRQFMCSTCGAEFYTIYACKEHHMRVHQGIKRYECSVCHQQYNEKKSFMKHLQKHSVDLVLKLDGGDIIIEQTVEEAIYHNKSP